jgi:hypothetical protein
MFEKNATEFLLSEFEMKGFERELDHGCSSIVTNSYEKGMLVD